MLEASRYCEQQVRQADKDHFLATLFAPAALRPHLYALYAFAIEIAQIRDRITNPLAGEVRLQWWRDALTAASGEAGGNPVAAALIATIARFGLPEATLLDLIDAHQFDLYAEPMASLADLEAYADATAGSVIRLAVHILSGSAPAEDDVIRSAGIALGMTDILWRLPLHVARGQLYLPADVLARHSVQPADIFARRTKPGLYAALADLVAVARRSLDAVRAEAGRLPPEWLPALLPLSVLPLRLRRLERDHPLQLSPVPQWRRQWAMWRAARRPAGV